MAGVGERVLFVGTPEFAVLSLRTLLGSYHVVGVLTQPDRPLGRGQRLSAPAVKQTALESDIPVLQPERVSTPEVIKQVSDLSPDVVIVVAFGQILKQDFLELAPYGCLNVHASLLPRWRGAAPVAAAILAGDADTGVTLMKLDAGLDSGPILVQQEEPIGPADTRLELEMRLARVGADLLVDTLPGYFSGDIVPRPQSEHGVTFARRLRKADGMLNWSQPAVQLERQLRAFTPWPGVYTTWKGRKLRILRASAVPCLGRDGPPGTVVSLDDGVAVIAGDGALRLKEVQLAGRRRMDIAAFLCGQRECIGSSFGSEG